MEDERAIKEKFLGVLEYITSKLQISLEKSTPLHSV